MHKVQIDMIVRATITATVLIMLMALALFVGNNDDVVNVVPTIILITLIGCGTTYMIYTPPLQYE